ncbi:S8 family peptidase [Thiogranum longum]
MLKRIMVLGLSLSVCLGGFSAFAADPGLRPTTQKLIIRLKNDGLRRIQSVRPEQEVPDVRLPDGRPLRFERYFDGNGMVVRLPEEVTLEDAQHIADQLTASSAIESAQPNKRMYPALVPNDPDYPPDFADPVNDPGQWHLFEDTAGIRMPAAWDRATGSSAVVVAHIDTGILSHRDLNPLRILPGYDFITDVATANDGDSRDPDPTDPGDATVDDECGAGIPGEDSSWHGLSVAGVMVAESDNFIDIAGIDFAARLLPLRVLGKCGGDLSDVADAIRWAAGLSVAGVPDNTTPARVITLSLSGPGLCSPEEQAAINAAVSAGAVVVAAAGNETTDVASVSPANCNNVIAVGAVGRDGSRASYTNVGEEVDLSAPGGDGSGPTADGVLTLYNTGPVIPALDTLAFIQGTSFTTAQVSAVAALMWAVNNTLNPGMIEDLLRLTARPFPDASCTTSTCGRGILDADAALAGAADPASVLGAATDFGSGRSGGSGGGCSAMGGTRFDPLLILCLIVAGMRVLSCNLKSS